MIRLKKEVILNAQLGIKGVPYMRALSPYFDDEKGLVTATVQHFTLIEKEFQIINESKRLVNATFNYLNHEYNQTVVFKRSTWNSNYLGFTENDYDDIFIASIDKVNKFERENSWSSNPAQRISYWAKPEFGGITANDIEKLTPSIIVSLNIYPPQLQELKLLPTT